MKYDTIPLNGHKKNSTMVSPNISKASSPSPLSNNLSSNLMGGGSTQQISTNKRNVIDSLGYSL